MYRCPGPNSYTLSFTDYLSTQKDKLPPLPGFEQLTPRVIRFLGDNPGQVSKRSIWSE